MCVCVCVCVRACIPSLEAVTTRYESDHNSINSNNKYVR